MRAVFVFCGVLRLLIGAGLIARNKKQGPEINKGFQRLEELIEPVFAKYTIPLPDSHYICRFQIAIA